MNTSAWLVVGIGSLCVACGGSGSSSSSSGGGGGTTASGGSTSSGGTTASGGTGGVTSSGGGGTGGTTAMGNVYDNAPDTSNLAGCVPVGPLPNEDGTFAVTIFGPFKEAFTLESFTFVAQEGDKTTITNPWTVSVVVVPAGGVPTDVDPNTDAKPMPYTVLQTMPDGPAMDSQLSVTLDAPLAVAADESVVVSLRNTVGPKVSAILMCGDSTHPETNQWWNLDGTMAQMDSFGSTFAHDWWVTLVPAAK